MAWKGRAKHGFRGARGASLTEYALALVVLVVGSIGVFQTLEDNTADEVDKQANCISQRPPPLSCQPAALVPLGGGGGGGVGGDPGGGVIAPTRTGTIAPPTGEITRDAGPVYDVRVDLALTDDSEVPPAPAPDTFINGRVTLVSANPTTNGQFYYVSCTTDTDGECSMTFDSRFADVTQLKFDVIGVGIDVTYDFGNYPTLTVLQPPPDSTNPF